MRLLVLAAAVLVSIVAGCGDAPVGSTGASSAPLGLVGSPPPLATENLESEAPATAKPKPDAPPIPVKVTAVSKSVRRDGTASVGIKTNPGATCSIDVQYKSGSSTAAGLDPKKAGTTGSVVWKWKVGRNTTKGTWPIEMDCRLGDRTGSASTKFTVK